MALYSSDLLRLQGAMLWGAVPPPADCHPSVGVGKVGKL